MELVADINPECSLAAMWRAYLTSNSVAENLAKNRTSVVRAFLNARYYDGNRGQFLSEDPVALTLGNPIQISKLTQQQQTQILMDPQQLNFYSYGKDNPLRNTDPLGLAVLEGTASVGWWLGGGTIGGDIDTTNYRAQLIFAGSAGPTLGGRFQGSYDPNGTLDPSGFYFYRRTVPWVLARVIHPRHH